MKKSIYIYFRIVHDTDMQDRLEVSLAGVVMTLFDIRSLQFVDWLSQYLCRYDGVMPLSFELNVPATGKNVQLYGFDTFSYKNFPQMVASFGSVLLDYRKAHQSNYESVIPDLLNLFGLFFTTDQRIVCGLQHF